MPYLNTVNGLTGLSTRDKLYLARELDLLRQELTEIRRAYMALRALLVAGTVVGAGYNTTPTNLGDAAATAAATSPRFTPT